MLAREDQMTGPVTDPVIFRLPARDIERLQLPGTGVGALIRLKSHTE